jgi:hypothetical protein
MNWLPYDIARCNGMRIESEEYSGWRKDCETCLRRTAPRPEIYTFISAPHTTTEQCEHLIEPEKP